FSSRRRHTRFSRDWSSDVCSSDLTTPTTAAIPTWARCPWILSSAWRGWSTGRRPTWEWCGCRPSWRRSMTEARPGNGGREAGTVELQWFPGHMAKARRELAQRLKLVHVVLEIIDARIPETSRHPRLLAAERPLPRVLLLSKADLADEAMTKAWLEYFRSLGQSAAAADLRGGAWVRRARALLRAAARDAGRRRGATRVLVAGLPNVGKSTAINSLAGRAKAATGATAGVTRGLQWLSGGPGRGSSRWPAGVSGGPREPPARGRWSWPPRAPCRSGRMIRWKRPTRSCGCCCSGSPAPWPPATARRPRRTRKAPCGPWPGGGARCCPAASPTWSGPRPWSWPTFAAAASVA